jgi:hypothetical protein
MNNSQLEEIDKIMEEFLKKSERIANECMVLMGDPNDRNCKAALNLCRKIRRFGALSAEAAGIVKEENDER